NRKAGPARLPGSCCPGKRTSPPAPEPPDWATGSAHGARFHVQNRKAGPARQLRKPVKVPGCARVGLLLAITRPRPESRPARPSPVRAVPPPPTSPLQAPPSRPPTLQEFAPAQRQRPSRHLPVQTPARERLHSRAARLAPHANSPPRAPLPAGRSHHRPPPGLGPPDVRLRCLPRRRRHLRDGLARGSHRPPPPRRAAPGASRAPRRRPVAPPRHGGPPVGPRPRVVPRRHGRARVLGPQGPRRRAGPRARVTPASTYAGEDRSPATEARHDTRPEEGRSRAREASVQQEGVAVRDLRRD